jgi:hypothetical protein
MPILMWSTLHMLHVTFATNSFWEDKKNSNSDSSRIGAILDK